MRKLVLAVAALVPALLVAGITVSAANSPAQIVDCPPAPGCFSPNPISIKVGDTVTWTNNGSVTHTSTSNTGTWNTGNIATGATSVAVTFNTAGTFAYHCAIHPSMTGSVVVSAVSATAAPTSPPVAQLAPGGLGPVLPVGAALLLLGLALLVSGRRRHRLQRVREPIDETPDQ